MSKVPLTVSSMKNREKDLLIAAYINDTETKVTSIHKQSGKTFETWMVLSLDNADQFLKEHQQQSDHNLLVISKYRTSSHFIEEFISKIEQHKFPISKARCWYNAETLREFSDRINRLNNHKFQTIFSSKTSKNKVSH